MATRRREICRRRGLTERAWSEPLQQCVDKGGPGAPSLAVFRANANRCAVGFKKDPAGNCFPSTVKPFGSSHLMNSFPTNYFQKGAQDESVHSTKMMHRYLRKPVNRTQSAKWLMNPKVPNPEKYFAYLKGRTMKIRNGKDTSAVRATIPVSARNAAAATKRAQREKAAATKRAQREKAAAAERARREKAAAAKKAEREKAAAAKNEEREEAAAAKKAERE